jgi:hypothetical protein
MGEAKRRKIAGLRPLPTLKASDLIEQGQRSLRTPVLEHDKWAKPAFKYEGKTLIVQDAAGNALHPDFVALKMHEAGKSAEEILNVVEAMRRPWPSPELNALPPFPAFDALVQAVISQEPYDPEEAGRPYQGQRSFGRKNKYVCDDPGCAHTITTVDIDEGVTPFMTACEKCNGTAVSRMYRVDQTEVETHEWFRPQTLEGLKPHSQEHVRRGGLLLRKIERNEPSETAIH